MEALHSRISYASWRLRVFRRLFLPSNVTINSRRIISTITARNNNNDTCDESSIKNNTTYQDVQDPHHIPPSQLLPQSPLITNPYPERAIRHRKKRPPTPSDLSDLSKNPWAMALASPVRYCTVTGARVPKAFLTDWGLVKATAPPQDDSPAPDDSPTTSSSSSSTKAAGDEKEAEKLWVLPISLMKDDLLLQKPGARTETPYLKMRMLNHLPTLDLLTAHLSTSRKKRRSPIKRLVPFRWRTPHGPLTPREEDNLAWRGDMPEFVLAMMRREALKALKSVSDTFKRQDVANGVWRSVLVDMVGVENGGKEEERALMRGLEKMEQFERMETGVVLVMGEEASDLPEVKEDGEILEDGGAEVAEPLPEFITLPSLNTKVPVFDLRYMLSDEDLQELRGHHERFQSFAVFLRPTDPLTIDAVLTMWKLRGLMRGS